MGAGVNRNGVKIGIDEYRRPVLVCRSLFDYGVADCRSL